MILNMIGGGGLNLNFSVVGGTVQLSSPSENTIWINTDQEINGYTFSAIAPINPVEGMVWIFVDDSSPVPFFATDENHVMIYPSSAQQYINNEWVTKSIQIYQNNEWVDWNIFYFSNWQENENGWQLRETTFGGYQHMVDHGDITLTKNDNGSITLTDHLQVIEASGGYGNVTTQRASIYETINEIDLTNIETLYINVNISKELYYYHPMGFCIYKSNVTDPFNDAIVKIDFNDVVSFDSALKLDVSSLTGNYKIGVGLSHTYRQWGSGAFPDSDIINTITLKNIQAIM